MVAPLGDIQSGGKSKALAHTFQVTVRSYSNAVWYWPRRNNRRRLIEAQDRTSDGAEGDRNPGYYSAEPIIDPSTGQHVGEHMKNATSFEPDPAREPFKVTCP